MSTTLVTAAHVLKGFNPDGTPDILADAGILVAGDRILEIGDQHALALQNPAAKRLGGPGFMAIPGLVNAHHHVGLTPFQLGSPDHPLELWFASRLALRDVDLRLDTLYAAFEMIASGVTTVQHLHSRAPGNIESVLESAGSIIEAYREIGMRASYSFALRDQNRLVYEADEAFLARLPAAQRPTLAAHFARFALPLREQIEVFHELARRYGDNLMTAIQIAPSNLHWLSDAALASAAEMASQTGAPVHMHLLETPYQKAYAQKRTGGSALAFIERHGLVTPGLTIGHGVWMSEEDIEICAATGAHICHNCSSNLRLKSGIAPLNRFSACGIPIALGIDEAGINDDRDMLQEMRLVLNMHRQPGIESPCPTPSDVLRMATQGGAGTTAFGNQIGRLAEGGAADIVLVDWARTIWPYQNADIPLVDVLVHRARREGVDTVMIGGEVVLAHGIFTKVDRAAVLTEIHERMKQPLTASEEGRRAMVRDVMPSVRRFYNGFLD